MPYSLISLIFLLFTAAIFSVAHLPLSDADTGWHVMAGHYIIENGGIPFKNVFSYTTGDYQWLNLSWLWDVLASMADSLGGLYGVAALSIFTSAATVALLVWFCLKRGVGINATLLAVTLGFLVFNSGLLARPNLATNLFFLAYLVIFHSFDKNPAANRNKLIFAPIIMLLWVNMHGGFIAGFTIIGAYFLHFAIQKRGFEAKMLFTNGLMCAAALLANPLGIEVLNGASRTLSGPLQALILEWQPPSQPHHIAYLGIFTAVIIYNFRKISLAEKIIGVFWFLQAVESVRYLSVFAMVAVPVMASTFQRVVDNNEKLKKRDADYAADFSKPAVRKYSFIAACIASLLFITPFWPKLTGFDATKPENYPAQEIAYILKNHPDSRLFNHYDYGGYIIYASNGKLKTFIDGRAETGFPPEVVADYLKFHHAVKGWESILDKYEVETAIMPKNLGVQIDYFNTNWQKAYEGDKAAVYVRRK